MQTPRQHPHRVASTCARTYIRFTIVSGLVQATITHRIDLDPTSAKRSTSAPLSQPLTHPEWPSAASCGPRGAESPPSGGREDIIEENRNMTKEVTITNIGLDDETLAWLREAYPEAPEYDCYAIHLVRALRNIDPTKRDYGIYRGPSCHVGGTNPVGAVVSCQLSSPVGHSVLLGRVAEDGEVEWDHGAIPPEQTEADKALAWALAIDPTFTNEYPDGDALEELAKRASSLHDAHPWAPQEPDMTKRILAERELSKEMGLHQMSDADLGKLRKRLAREFEAALDAVAEALPEYFVLLEANQRYRETHHIDYLSCCAWRPGQAEANQAEADRTLVEAWDAFHRAKEQPGMQELLDARERVRKRRWMANWESTGRAEREQDAFYRDLDL